jgi:hypothetical protein
MPEAGALINDNAQNAGRLRYVLRLSRANNVIGPGWHICEEDM